MLKKLMSIDVNLSNLVIYNRKQTSSLLFKNILINLKKKIQDIIDINILNY